MSIECLIHYDQEADLFKSFLCRYMKYTSGLYLTGRETLDEATRQMLDLIIAKSEISDESKILEIGPGWGSLITRLQEKGLWNSKNYLGISPSRIQNKYIHQFVASEAQLITRTLEESEILNAKDAIVLIGSFCHLKDKFETLRRFSDLLKPGGLLVIEDSFFLTRELFSRHANHPKTKYVQKSIFGFAEIPPLSDLIEMAQSLGFMLQSVEENTDSYARTINEWQNRINSHPSLNFEQKSPLLQYLHIAQQSWNYTVSNQLIVFKKISLKKSQLKLDKVRMD